MASLLAHYKSSDLSPRLRRSLAILCEGKTALETFLKSDRVAVRDHLLGKWLVTFKHQSVSLSLLSLLSFLFSWQAVGNLQRPVSIIVILVTIHPSALIVISLSLSEIPFHLGSSSSHCWNNFVASSYPFTLAFQT